MWVTAAPALAASITAAAICFAVMGIAGCLPAVSPAPVTAQVTMTSVFIASFSLSPGSSGCPTILSVRRVSRAGIPDKKTPSDVRAFLVPRAIGSPRLGARSGGYPFRNLVQAPGLDVVDEAAHL